MKDLKYTEIIELNKVLSKEKFDRKYKIGVISNVTVNSFTTILEYKCRVNSIEPEVVIGNFDNIVQDSFTLREKDLVIVLFDIFFVIDQLDNLFENVDDGEFENLKRNLQNTIDLAFSNLQSTSTVIFNKFSSFYFLYSPLYNSITIKLVKELNAHMESVAPANVVLVDIDRIFSEAGFDACFDQRFYESSKAPYSLVFWKGYSDIVENVLIKNTGKYKKALIFDCDNTLWAGILGEDGMEGIEMSSKTKKGKFFKRVQQIASYLAKRGIIIGLCSKNNECDVLEVLRTHKDVFIKEDEITIHQVNWNDKASNLHSISRELNIGLDSLIFVDDSSFEINLINQKLPEILTIQVPAKLSDYPGLILKYSNRYFNLNPIQEDLNKVAMYKKQFERESTKNAFDSIEDYLGSLQIQLIIKKNDKDNLVRITQLTQKTNQFNLTTKRYTETQVGQFMNQPGGIVFSLSVADKFGDSGLTGICIVAEGSEFAGTAHIDTLLMSCRVIGRNIEFVFLNHVIEYLKKMKYRIITADYFFTKKNLLVEYFYDRAGFKVVSNNENDKKYQLIIDNYKPVVIDYINLNTE
jgi:FkbH-like protein